ncbi:MAG: c-type cytochrome biogenesis protein CcmI [Pseudomonadota bacterium]
MGFWIATGAFSALVALTIILAYLRPRGSATPAAAYDLQVYRDQLKELDRDLARRVISEEEAARAKTEVARRILEADKALQKAEAAEAKRGGMDKVALGGGLVLTIAGAFGVYLMIGAPGYPDLPLQTRIEMVEDAREARPGQAEAEGQVGFREGIPPDPEREAMVAQLRTVLERRPDDVEGVQLLAVNEAALGNFRAARLAQGRVIELLGDEATGQHFVDHAEMMVLAAGGYVSPEAERALVRALELAPRNGTARYYAGLMFAQQGRPDLAFPIWRNLLADSEPGAPWVEPIQLQIEEVAMLAGERVSLSELAQPQAIPGPTADDIAAAQDLAPEDQIAMIEGMVEGLATRLGAEGGPPEDWARLIGAYLVLNRRDAAQAVYENALEVFADVPEALEAISAAAAPLIEASE